MGKKKDFDRAADFFVTKRKPEESVTDKAPDVVHDEVHKQEHEVKAATTPVTLDIRPSRTQGKKGASKPRINMRFEPELYNFMKDLSERSGVNITEYVNNLIYQDKVKRETDNQ